MNKRHIFIQTLKTAVLISAVLAMLPVYVHASYDLGSFSGAFVPVYDDKGNIVNITPHEIWHTLTVTHSGELVLSSASSGTFSSSGSWFNLFKPDKSDAFGSANSGGFNAALKDGVITVSNIAPGTYYIRASQWRTEYGTYTIQAAFTNADDNLTESEPNDAADNAKLFTDKVTGIIGYTDGIKRDTQDWFRYEITRSGKLVLSSASSGTFSSSGSWFNLLKPDKSGALGIANSGGVNAALKDGVITVSNIAPGTYYIRASQYGTEYGTYTIQTAFTPDISAIGLQDDIVCLRILSGIPVSSSEIIITDISKDGRIGMEECVYILQAVAGLRP